MQKVKVKSTCEKLQEFYQMFQPFMDSEIDDIETQNLITGHSICNITEGWRYLWDGKHWVPVEFIDVAIKRWFLDLYGDEL